jgi:hypothetical protein
VGVYVRGRNGNESADGSAAGACSDMCVELCVSCLWVCMCVEEKAAEVLMVFGRCAC